MVTSTPKPAGQFEKDNSPSVKDKDPDSDKFSETSEEHSLRQSKHSEEEEPRDNATGFESLSKMFQKQDKKIESELNQQEESEEK